ncbi:MAG TPA: SdrD B-like domain-containing protein, partial [Thermoanaerobaculia bacterium]|nr:SdrD B-like domain-containing protein [Thermoanaerobaculia bacterium]
MKAQRQILQGALSLLVGAFMGLGVAQAQLGPGPFAAFPTQDATDGRFMGFGCAGIATFEQNVAISMAAPAATSTFDLNIFDGDTGKPDGSLLPHWDAGTRQLIFSLYADPLRTGSTAPANLIGSWAGNAANPTSGPLWTSSATFMPDNAWWAVTVTNAPISQAPSGNYFYNLVISLDGTCGIGEILESNIKVAASNPMTFRTPQFGLVGGFRQIFNDGPILYPGPVFPPLGGFLSAPTTYDGTFEFYFSLPGGTTELRLFDGDFDFGTDSTVGVPSGVFLDPCEDEDDPDTPSDYSGFPFSTTGANPEGVQGPGAPPDDNNFDAFRRGEPDDPNRIGCVRYEVQDPLGNVYHNDNPSGSFEWEQFLIATADSPFVGDADYVAGGATLPGGVWKVRIVGLDLANLNFWFADTCATRPARDPMPGEDPDNVPRVAACSDQSIYLLGDFVWADTANPGTLDPGEAGTPGVVMELIRPSDGAVIATTKTGDSTSPNWPACVAHNTGTDTNGLYCFGTDAPGTYQVRVAASNFAPTKPLAGKASTTGGDSLTRTLTTGNVLTYDFGYDSVGSLGDRIWLDTDGDGVQDGGEPGINGVTVELLNSGGTVISTQVTSGSGNYTFGGLPAGSYSVRVVAATLPAGLVQTYDLDGLGTANLAAATLTAGQNRTDVDFGYRGTASVGDRVWADTDGDGVQDAGETGINGVTVELLDSGNTVIGTKVTAGDGNYTFANLDAGNYSVRVVAATLPAGSAPTYDLDGIGTANIASFALTGGQNRTDVDFGYRGTASVGDRVWTDTNGNGVQEAGETGINGVTVELLNSGGTVIATTMTAGDGNYGFTNLSAGNYSVRVVAATLPAGSAPTFDLDGIGTANIASFALTAGQNRTDVDFGYRGAASVGDRVWTDTNGNGVQEAGEAGINGVTVELLNSGGTVIASQATAGDGNYSFTNLSAGNYSVRVVTATLPAGSTQTYDLDGVGTANIASFALTGGQNRTDVDFGYRGTASVGDRVWTDTNGDGVQDAGETGINGVTVELLNSGGTVIATKVTAGDGNYTFTNLAAGNYSVRVVAATLPAGSAQTYDLDGVGTANIAAFSLTAGQSKTDVDFGYRGAASVGDRVWTDTDGDGVQDAGETGINGVTVELLNSGGTVIASKVTAGDGNYTFTNLSAGNYSVRVVAATLPAGSAQTFDLDGTGTANIAAFALVAGQNKTDVDFGYRGTGSLGDRVWLDFDADGIQDAGETGINGVTVELLNSGGTVIASQVTA